MSGSKPLIIAHRGASALAPENTLAAFRKAIDDGADGIEFDVRLARDGVPVVIHDANLRRVGRIRGSISDFTSEELGKIDVGSWFSAKNPIKADAHFAFETVPTLAGVLEFLCDFSGLIYVELKCSSADFEPLTAAVIGILKNSPLRSQIIVKSFELETIPKIRELCPAVKTAALFTAKLLTILDKEKYLFGLAETVKADQLSLHYSLATRKLMEKAAAKNLPVTIWTVDNRNWVQRASDLGVRAIITNDPQNLGAAPEVKG